MEGLTRTRWFRRFDFDALAGRRDLAMFRLACLGSGVLLAYALQHALAGRTQPALVNLAAVLVLGSNALSLHFRRRPAYPYLVLSILLLAVVCTSVYIQGTPGLFWAYPVVIVNFFTLVVWRALAMSALTLLGVTLAALLGPAAELALRFAISMAFVLVMVMLITVLVADLRQALVEQTLTDPLTGAFNRRRLDFELESSQPPQPGAQSADALLLIDVDHFKPINDQHGHDAGDCVLRELAGTLSARKRAGDQLFRMGGEEFVLLVRRVNEEAALQVAEALRQTVMSAPLLPGQRVTVSVGVCLRQPGLAPEPWLKLADRALYAAKHAGRNCVVSAHTLPPPENPRPALS